MKKFIYTSMIMAFGTLATIANPVSNFKPYEHEGTQQDTSEASQANQSENNEATSAQGDQE